MTVVTDLDLIGMQKTIVKQTAEIKRLRDGLDRIANPHILNRAYPVDTHKR